MELTMGEGRLRVIESELDGQGAVVLMDMPCDPGQDIVEFAETLGLRPVPDWIETRARPGDSVGVRSMTWVSGGKSVTIAVDPNEGG
jgi:hypothetical protein